jgi:hypothetical protein
MLLFPYLREHSSSPGLFTALYELHGLLGFICCYGYK